MTVTYITDITTSRDRAAAALAEALIAPKTSHSVGGVSWSHDQHIEQLTATFERLNILAINLGATEIRTQVFG